ncbi:hypothetical protein ACH4UA_35590, partial [Streptomyces sp. NPDC020939]
SLLGIGNLASKVKSVFHAVAKPVNRVIDKIVGFIVKIGKKIWAKLKSKFGKKKNEGKGKGDGKDAAASGDRPVVRVPFDMAGDSHSLTFTPKGGDVDVVMASVNPRDLTEKFSTAHARIDYFRNYIESIEDPKVKAGYEAQILPWLESFTRDNVATFRSIYKEWYPARGEPNRPSAATDRISRMTSQAEQALQNLKEWAAKTGIPDLEPEAINRTINVKGAEIWKEEFDRKKQLIESVVGGFRYRGNPIQYRGSMESGWRGPQKGKTHYDPKDFDVDMYVIDPEDFERIAERKGLGQRTKWIKGDAVYAPELLRLSLRVAQALQGAFPEVKGIGDSKVILRRSEPGQ